MGQATETGSGLRVLVVGGGIAGLTLAALLDQQAGREVVVIEKARTFADVGYSLGIYPLGSSVLHGLGRYEDLVQRGEVASTYRVLDRKGNLLQDVDLGSFTGDIGPMVLLSRTELHEILLDAASGADLRMGTTFTRIAQHGDGVEVEFSDGRSEEFDVVVGCDGLHSQTREVVASSEPEVFDTGWDLWTWWAPLPDWERDINEEYWGTGRFFGLYPTTDRVMVCAGMRRDHLTVDPADVPAAKTFLSEHFQTFEGVDERIRESIEQASTFFAWPMSDARSTDWVKGRVALVGDAAAGFMPTAGAGANTALRSAASLADELSRVDGRIAPLALEVFEKRCRKIIETNQKDSRRLSRYLFVDGAARAWSRDEVMKHYPVGKLVGDIVDSMHNPF